MTSPVRSNYLIAGALLSLWYFRQTVNMFSQIGIIMLIGLVTKNGILIVEFANQRREAGLRRTEAVVNAAAARLRPILTTSFSTIPGILPIALGIGSGAESRVSMGIAVIGGLIFSGGLTLYVIPAVYAYLPGVRSAEAIAAARGATPAGFVQAAVINDNQPGNI